MSVANVDRAQNAIGNSRIRPHRDELEGARDST